MHPVYTNGRDTSIDSDFFVGLGADRDSIHYTEREQLKYGETELSFRIDDDYYSAKWSSYGNRIEITCEGLSYDQDQNYIASCRLMVLYGKVTKDMFGDFIVKKVLTFPEGYKPQLTILLYEE